MVLLRSCECLLVNCSSERDLDVSHILRHSKVIVTHDSYIKRFDSRALTALVSLAESSNNKGRIRDRKKSPKSKKPCSSQLLANKDAVISDFGPVAQMDRASDF